MTKKRQNVDGAELVLYFSANLRCIKTAFIRCLLAHTLGYLEEKTVS
jgi:hypothetical protein